MELVIDSHSTHVYTGGRPLDAARPAIVLVHGAGHDHSVWNHPARRLAHHGFSVLAPDLPGHGRSGGPALPDVPALAAWIAQLVEACGVGQAVLVGHSMGSLIALHCAATQPALASALVLVGSVAPMPVAPALLEAARSARERAHAMINQWSFAPASQLGASPTPGTRLVDINRRLMERQAEGVLANDLAACNAYQEGLGMAAEVRVPTLLVCGERDQMTPPRATKPLAAALVNVPGGARTMTLGGAGHAMMAEAPEALARAIEQFAGEHTRR